MGDHLFDGCPVVEKPKVIRSWFLWVAMTLLKATALVAVGLVIMFILSLIGMLHPILIVLLVMVASFVGIAKNVTKQNEEETES